VVHSLVGMERALTDQKRGRFGSRIDRLLPHEELARVCDTEVTSAESHFGRDLARIGLGYGRNQRVRISLMSSLGKAIARGDPGLRWWFHNSRTIATRVVRRRATLIKRAAGLEDRSEHHYHRVNALPLRYPSKPASARTGIWYAPKPRSIRPGFAGS